MRHTRFGLVALSGSFLSLLAVGCGHAGFIEDALHGNAGSGSTTPSTGGATGTGSGGGPSSSGGSTPSACGTMPADKTRPGYTAERDPVVASLLQSMTIDEKYKQMYGVHNPAQHNSAAYLDIERSQDADGGNGKTVRGYRYRDAGRGVNLAAGQYDRPSDQMTDYSTAFPCESVRAASFDVNLEYDVGEAMGDETMASKNNMLLAPCMNIIRHPYWGRTQETYSEDMHHTGRMASAFTAGLQQHVIGCAKHFAANNVENNRSNQNAHMNEQTLREIYGRHFEMVVQEGGIGCIMASYNLINMVKNTQNKHLLRDILRTPVAQGGFGYKGFVLSDWWAMPGDQAVPDLNTATTQTIEAVKAGLNLELPWDLHYSALSAAMNNGLTINDINEAVGQILEQKARFHTLYIDDPMGMGTPKSALSGVSLTNTDDHLNLAEETEVRSAVLLTNGNADAPVLPIKSTQKNIAVVGLNVKVTVSSQTKPPVTGTQLDFSSTVNIGDRGSSRVNADPTKSVGAGPGIKNIADTLHPGNFTVTTGNTADAAASADFVVVVVGLTAGDEGEEYSLDSHGDRTSLDLPNKQADFVASVIALGKPTAVIVESGSIVNLPWVEMPSATNPNVATIWAGYGGQRQGNAFGKLLFGDRNFSGKMPLAWPNKDFLPNFRTGSGSTDMGYFFGYRHYDNLARLGTPATLVFPFGHGLSYTKFAYSDLTMPCAAATANDVIDPTVKITNTGTVDGEEVAFLFVQGPPKPAGITGDRPVKELKAFTKVSLKATGQDGSSQVVHLPFRVQDLRHWEGEADGHWTIDAGTYTILVGGSADAKDLTQMGTFTFQG